MLLYTSVSNGLSNIDDYTFSHILHIRRVNDDITRIVLRYEMPAREAFLLKLKLPNVWSSLRDMKAAKIIKRSKHNHKWPEYENSILTRSA